MEVCRKLGNIKLENRPYTEVSQYNIFRTFLILNFKGIWEFGNLGMKNEMNLMRQTVDVLIKSATHQEDYGKELETLDDIAAVLNTLECNIDRK